MLKEISSVDHKQDPRLKSELKVRITFVWYNTVIFVICLTGMQYWLKSTFFLVFNNFLASIHLSLFSTVASLSQDSKQYKQHQVLVFFFAPTPRYANVLFFHIKEQPHERTPLQVNKNTLSNNGLYLKHQFCPSTSLQLKIVYIVKVNQVYLPTYPVSTKDYSFDPTVICLKKM